MLDMIDSLTPEVQKSILLYYIRCYGDISLIMIDTIENKITWYNKPLYMITKKALVYVNNQHIMCFRDTTLLKPFIISEEMTEEILSCINGMCILNDDIVMTNDCIAYIEHGMFYALMNHKLKTTYATESKAKNLCLFLGKMLYKYIVSNNKCLTDTARDFDEYLIKYYEKITYLIC